MVLPCAPECHLDAAHRASRHSGDGGRAGKGEDMALSSDLRCGHGAGLCARHARHGRLLRHGRFDGVCVLFSPRQRVVEAVRADRGALLDQCVAHRRTDFPDRAFRTGV